MSMWGKKRMKTKSENYWEIGEDKVRISIEVESNDSIGIASYDILNKLNNVLGAWVIRT